VQRSSQVSKGWQEEGSAKNKLSARYWACKNLWAGKGGSKKSSPKGVRGKY